MNGGRKIGGNIKKKERKKKQINKQDEGRRMIGRNKRKKERKKEG